MNIPSKPTIRAFVFNGEPARIDRVLASESEAWPIEERISRSQFQRYLDEGKVSRNGAVVRKASEQVAHGDTIEVAVSPLPPFPIEPTNFPLDILFEDDALIILNKPPNISMHPGAGAPTTTIASAVLFHLGGSLDNVGAEGRPGIVHRLDKDTTGLVVIAKTPAAHAALARQFEVRTVGRVYTALVFTTPRATRLVRSEDEGLIETEIGRSLVDRKKMTVVTTGGRKATTRWKVIERMPYGSLVEVRLGTGRTHQIRVHMDHIGSPVIGDTVYGDFSGLPSPLQLAAQKFGRQALHAGFLAITHPVSRERMEFSAPVPEDLGKLIQVFRETSS